MIVRIFSAKYQKDSGKKRQVAIMSMISSLDALEAATEATSVPRAAVFQPKVKARLRKGGGGGQANSAPPNPPPGPVPRERAGTASANPTPIPALARSVEKAAEIVARASELANAVPVVDIKADPNEESSACQDAVTRASDDVAVLSSQNHKSGVTVEGSRGLFASSDSVSPEEALKIREEPAPVAVRTSFPLLPAATGVISLDKDSELIGRSSLEWDDAGRVASEPSRSLDVRESGLAEVQSQNSVRSPQFSNGGRAGLKILVRRSSLERDDAGRVASEPSRSLDVRESGLAEDQNQNAVRSPQFFNGGRAGLKTLARKDTRPPEAAIEEEEEKDEPIVEREEEKEATDAIPEVVSTGKRGRKRKFSHATSQPRMNRADKDGVALTIDFSKTDLSNPGKLTMREIIRRAEAIERTKLKAQGNKKSAQNDGKEKQAASMEGSERSAVSMAPQVQVINGRIVVNEQSLTVGAYATSRLNTETYTRVEENAPRLNYNSYRDKIPTERWKADDTDVFYLALKQFGTDFEVIQNLFPGRTRRQVKAKFKKEEKNNPRRLQDALAHRSNDHAHYTDMINRLKRDESDPIAEDPFTSILAYTKNAVTGQPTDVT